MLERMLLDGDVEEGSGFALRATYFLTADSEEELDLLAAELRERLPEAKWETTRAVPPIVADSGVRDAVAQAFAVLGREFVADSAAASFRNGLRRDLAPGAGGV